MSNLRSPLRGDAVWTPPAPSWAAAEGDDAFYVNHASDATYRDMHFADIDGVAISLENASNVIIERCTFANVSKAIYLAAATNIVVRDCAFYNILGSAGGEWSGMGNAVQFNQADTVTVEDCWSFNDSATGTPEDLISLYATSNATVRRNRLWHKTASGTGGCIAAGDGDVVDNGDDILLEDNVCIDGAIGILGSNVTAQRNVVANRGLDTNGDEDAPIAVFNNYENGTLGPVTLAGNRTAWFTSDGSRRGVRVGTANDPMITGRHTTDIFGPVDVESEWTPTGYFGWSS